MTAGEHVVRLLEALDQAVPELDLAIEEAPDWAAAALRLGRAELLVVRRRLDNARRALGGPPHPAA